MKCHESTEPRLAQIASIQSNRESARFKHQAFLWESAATSLCAINAEVKRLQGCCIRDSHFKGLAGSSQESQLFCGPHVSFMMFHVTTVVYLLFCVQPLSSSHFFCAVPCFPTLEPSHRRIRILDTQQFRKHQTSTVRGCLTLKSPQAPKWHDPSWSQLRAGWLDGAEINAFNLSPQNRSFPGWKILSANICQHTWEFSGLGTSPSEVPGPQCHGLCFCDRLNRPCLWKMCTRSKFIDGKGGRHTIPTACVIEDDRSPSLKWG